MRFIIKSNAMKKASRRDFLRNSLAGGAAIAITPALISKETGERSRFTNDFRSKREDEWRNRVESMHYRRFGNTGLMLSELVMGTFGRNKILVAREAIERGVNYFDVAQRYARGRNEEAIGEIVSEAGMRDRIFISTKISAYLPTIDALAKDVINGLPSEKLHAIRKRSLKTLDNAGVQRTGYHFDLFPGHDQELPEGYLTSQIVREFGHHPNFKNELRKKMDQAIDGSLRRLKTDYVDVLHCPHGARLPEELEEPTIQEFYEDAKKSGKVRFAGVSVHSDVPSILNRAAELSYYDVAMVAYNIANQGTMELAITRAAEQGMGLIAMKAARAINREIDGRPVPSWRLDKLNQAISGDEKAELKAYVWALQNSNITSVISHIDNSDMLQENLAVCGRRVDLGIV